jgi:hypothetical protein
MTRTRAILSGGLVVGILDGLDAVIFFGLRGVRPIRIFQAIASGLLGRAAFTGGLRTALLGVLCHFIVATSIVAVYFALSRKVDVMRRQPIASGMAYGVIAYLVMNYVVIPLSAVAPGGPKPLAVVANGLLIHMFGVGIPAAIFANRVEPQGHPER